MPFDPHYPVNAEGQISLSALQAAAEQAAAAGGWFGSQGNQLAGPWGSAFIPSPGIDSVCPLWSGLRKFSSFADANGNGQTYNWEFQAPSLILWGGMGEGYLSGDYDFGGYYSFALDQSSFYAPFDGIYRLEASFNGGILSPLPIPTGTTDCRGLTELHLQATPLVKGAYLPLYTEKLDGHVFYVSMIYDPTVIGTQFTTLPTLRVSGEFWLPAAAQVQLLYGQALQLGNNSSSRVTVFGGAQISISMLSSMVPRNANGSGWAPPLIGPTGLRVRTGATCSNNPGDCCTDELATISGSPPATGTGAGPPNCCNVSGPLCLGLQGLAVNAGPFTLAQTGSNSWGFSGAVGTCLLATIGLSCDSRTGLWTLTFNGAAYGSKSPVCSPFSLAGASGIDLTGCGGLVSSNWSVTAGACSGGGGANCCTGNCGDPGVLATLTATFTNKVGAWTAMPNTATLPCQPLGAGQHGWYVPSPGVATVFGQTQISEVSCVNGSLAWSWSDSLGGGHQANAQPGYTCNPMSAVFLVDDGAGNTMTVTVVSP